MRRGLSQLASQPERQPAVVPEAQPGAWAGEIVTVPDADDRVEVVLPAFSDDRPHGPCDYMPRAAQTPAPGDPCVVVFVAGADGAVDPVIVWWRPA